MTYIENEKLPEKENISNQVLVNILGEIRKAKESLVENENKLRLLLKRQYEMGNTITINGITISWVCGFDTPMGILFSTADSLMILGLLMEYGDITSVVIKRSAV